MHPQARDYVARQAVGHTFHRVVEFGSRDINGGVRDLFDTGDYHGLDIAPGAGVDEVTDAATWTTRKKVDAVVCCEVLEHTPDWRDLIANAAALLCDGGTLIVTAACDPREPHSGHDGRPLTDDSEHYANVDPDELAGACEDAGLTVDDLEVHDRRGDVYLTASKP